MPDADDRLETPRSVDKVGRLSGMEPSWIHNDQIKLFHLVEWPLVICGILAVQTSVCIMFAIEALNDHGGIGGAGELFNGFWIFTHLG